jgi:hypothetical protein
MPFCTKCGANVSGTFCSQCGTPAASAAAQAPPPQAPPPQAAPYVQAAPYTQPGTPYGQPAPRKTSPIVWVLVIVLGLFVLGGLAVVGSVAYFAHRVHQAVQINPGGDGFAIKARGDDGKDASVQFGGSIGKLPSWVPAYPGADPKGTFSVKSGNGEGGNFTFTTSDDTDKVKAFYADKCKDLGMKTNLETTTSDGAMFVAADENGDKRSLTVVIGKSGRETTVNVTYGLK